MWKPLSASWAKGGDESFGELSAGGSVGEIGERSAATHGVLFTVDILGDPQLLKGGLGF